MLGLDNSDEMIRIASEAYGGSEALRFEHGSVTEIDKADRYFDVVVAFFVLHFMKDEEELTEAAAHISKCLTDEGVLVATVPNGVKDYNPKREEGLKFGAAVNLKSSPELYDGRRVDVEFFDNGEVVGSSKVTFFFNETYERVLKKAGFTKVEFLNPVISAEGLELYGEEFFRSYLNPPKDIILRAYKL